MEFNEKLQELRKQKGITQEELAEKLFVSRTAVSKWESGRGYPNIDSLKAIAKFFYVTVDVLVSSDEIISIAENEKKRSAETVRDLVFGLADISLLLLFFLPLFAERFSGSVTAVSLISLGAVRPYLKVMYISITSFISLFGVQALALQNCKNRVWICMKSKLSLAFSALFMLFLVLSHQVYAAVFVFVLLSIKAAILIKRQ